jgi:hypothetical protein
MRLDGGRAVVIDDTRAGALISGTAFVAAMAQATSDVDAAISALRDALGTSNTHEHATARAMTTSALDKLAACVLMASRDIDRLWAGRLYRRKHAVIVVLQAGAQRRDIGPWREGSSGICSNTQSHAAAPPPPNIVRISGDRFATELA